LYFIRICCIFSHYLGKELDRILKETKEQLIAEIRDELNKKDANANLLQDAQYTAVIANEVVQALLNKILEEKRDHEARM
jgi:hypothetical protein